MEYADASPLGRASGQSHGSSDNGLQDASAATRARIEAVFDRQHKISARLRGRTDEPRTSR